MLNTLHQTEEAQGACVSCVLDHHCESYSRRIGFRTRLTIVPFLAVFKTSSNLFNKMAR